LKQYLIDNFEGFIGKHTCWELLYNPPDVSPMILNQTKKYLLQIFNTEIAMDEPPESSTNLLKLDLNKVVASIEENEPE
jgi:hypothetical protein